MPGGAANRSNGYIMHLAGIEDAYDRGERIFKPGFFLAAVSEQNKMETAR
jgi:hypothetical protein